MSYTYKSVELPDYSEKEWHILIDPFFRQIIDHMTLTDYIPVMQVDDAYTTYNVIYTGKENESSAWLIKKVIDDNTGVYSSSWATIANNASYTTLSAAFQDRSSLNYDIDYNNII